MKIKKMSTLALVAMTASTMALTGCSSDNETAAGSGGDSDDPVTIRVAWWGNQERHDRTLEVIDLFEEQYPNINVEAEFTDWDGYWQKLSTQAAGNDLPDVIQMDVTRLYEYDTNDLIIDLSSLIEDGTIHLDDVEDVYQEILMDGDRTLAISLGANAFAIIYNQTMADEYGVSFEPGDTYDDFITKLIELKAEIGDDFEGFGFGKAEYEMFTIFARQNGESMYTEDSTALGFKKQTLTDFFTMVQDMTNDGTALSLASEEVVVEGTEAIQNRSIIAQWAASNQIISRSPMTDQELSLALLPTLVGGQDGNWIRSAMSFSITSNSEQQEAAGKFIDFFTNSVEANKILQGDRGVPISSVVREAISETVSEPVRKTFDFLELVADYLSPVDALPPAGETEIGSAFLRYVETLKHNTLTPEEAAEQFMKEAESILN